MDLDPTGEHFAEIRVEQTAGWNISLGVVASTCDLMAVSAETQMEHWNCLSLSHQAFFRNSCFVGPASLTGKKEGDLELKVDFGFAGVYDSIYH